MSQLNVGVLGIGTYLPKQIRKNDWWPEQVVRKWRKLNVVRSKAQAGEGDTEGKRRVLAALEELKNDPFEGTRERRVVDEGMAASDMEAAAAEEALARAGIRRDQIDFLFGYSACPDLLGVQTVCATHHKLGLPSKCMTVTTDVVCNAFAIQLSLAKMMIATGQGRYGLLVQSSTISRVTDPNDPASAWFGDGATAVVVGPAENGKGILAQSHGTDGSLNRVLVYGVPGKRWYDEGRVFLYSEDRPGARKMVLSLIDRAQESVGDALKQAGVTPQQIDFFASHQGSSWLRRVCNDHLGLVNARGIDTFEWTGSLLAANVPMQLEVGAREGLLRDGDLVAIYAGGVGITWSGMVLRWGT
jgi:3-oxoacyl-[acyl-carrier-protein] synthase-3